MKKIINTLLVITSLFGYLEWGGGQHSFLFQAEAEILAKMKGNFMSVFHPAIVVPLIGQLLLLVTLFQRKPLRAFTIIGLSCLALIMLLILFIGLAARNMKMAGSAIPFIATAIWAVVYHRRAKE
ncbi:hypothetical protein ACTHGU_07635 [Chitinophagaceae bacterium MMS25-I14]